MLILALETSSARGGVAVLENDRVLAQKTWTRENSHSELLTLQIEECVRDAGLTLKKLNRIALGHGPGSFTGIRVAVNAARTLAYVMNIPVAAFDTTEIVVANTNRLDKKVLALVNAQKNAVFAGIYEYSSAQSQWMSLMPLKQVSMEQLEDVVTEPFLCVGDGFEVLPPTLVAKVERDSNIDDQPQPAALGLLAWTTRETRQPLVWKDVQALYIRAAGAEEKRRESQGK